MNICTYIAELFKSIFKPTPTLAPPMPKQRKKPAAKKVPVKKASKK